MIRLVRSQNNSVAVKVESFIKYDGFSATLVLPGNIQKQIQNLSAANISIAFTPNDIAAFGANQVDGVLTIVTDQSKEYAKQIITFSIVDTYTDVRDFQTIRIVLVQDINNGGGGDAKIKARLTELEKKNTMIGILPDPKQSIQSCQSSITSMLNVMRT